MKGKREGRTVLLHPAACASLAGWRGAPVGWIHDGRELCLPIAKRTQPSHWPQPPLLGPNPPKSAEKLAFHHATVFPKSEFSRCRVLRLVQRRSDIPLTENAEMNALAHVQAGKRQASAKILDWSGWKYQPAVQSSDGYNFFRCSFSFLCREGWMFRRVALSAVLSCP